MGYESKVERPGTQRAGERDEDPAPGKSTLVAQLQTETEPELGSDPDNSKSSLFDGPVEWETLGEQEQQQTARADVAGAKPAPKAKQQQFKTLKGNMVDKTTPAEAKALKALRSSAIRIDPRWLIVAQSKVLHVTDATGAMNTETLRAIYSHANRVVRPDEMLTDAFLDTILAPSHPDAPAGVTALSVTKNLKDGFASETKNTKATTRADKAAQAVGYADYESYKREFEDVSFLGFPLNKGAGTKGQAHPYLIARLKLAEEFLRGMFGSDKDDAKIAKLAGWNGQGGAEYGTGDADIKKGASHQHTMGLAIDIDAYANGWVWDEHHNAHASMDKHLGLAARIFGGAALTAGGLDRMSDQTSTEELHATVAGASSSFGKYLAMVKKWKREHDDASDKKVVETKLVGELHKLGIKEADETFLKDVLWFAGWFNKASYRKGMTQLTNIKLPMLVALRDVAGLTWGGAEMDPRENGDFMHFDCRDTPFGNAVVKRMSPEEQQAEREERAKATKKK